MAELKNDLFADIQDEVKEHYTFTFTKDEVVPIGKKNALSIKKKLIFFILFGVICAICGIVSDKAVADFGVGAMIMVIVMYAKLLSNYKKSVNASIEKIEKTVYDYTIYRDFMIIWLSSDTSIRQTKVALNEIKNIKNCTYSKSDEYNVSAYTVVERGCAEKEFWYEASEYWYTYHR